MSAAGGMHRGTLRVRRDLTLTPDGDGVVVKDPLTLEYFRLGERERFLLEELREPLTLNELTTRFRARFPNDGATGAQVLAFCSAMAECSLLLSDSPQRVEPKKPKQAGWWSLLSPLAIRLPGVDPTPLLDATGWLGRLLFNRLFAGLLLLVALAVGVGLLGRADELSHELGQLTNLLEPRYALAAVLAVMLTKTWHELGHALACRRVGAECHEVGVMLLAFLPCLYCDASDAWTLTSRWRRVLVALAGVYFEAILAVAAAGVWLVLAPGPLRVLALDVVVIASLSTLLVNLNPLLRFDGYYVLADAWGVPNLHQHARETLWGGLRRWIAGGAPPERPAASPVGIALYGVASVAYGWAILGVILWAVYAALDAYGFAAAGDLLVALTLGGVVVGGGRSAKNLVPRGPGAPVGRSLLRLGVIGATLATVAWLVLSAPIEQSLRSPCRLENTAFTEVVARSNGLLRPLVVYGERVKPNQLLAELDEPAAELRRLELLEREASLRSQIEGLRTRSQTDTQLLSEIARLTPTLQEVRRQLATHDEQIERRRLRAPIAGRVLPPAERFENEIDAESSDGRLPTWSGAPLDPANAGCLLAGGEALCRVVGEPLRAVVLLDEDDSGLVRLGDPVRIALDREPAAWLSGRVEGVSPATADERLTDAERALERGLRGSLAAGSAYRVTVALDAPTAACQPGALGQARVVTGEETVGGWCLRWLRRLVRLG
ncbi:Peptidase family M50 [Planctomycetes bacterium MalM25]|nr:Peptidase family M50 [Planctomycetes bacterium MalM25]